MTKDITIKIIVLGLCIALFISLPRWHLSENYSFFLYIYLMSPKIPEILTAGLLCFQQAARYVRTQFAVVRMHCVLSWRICCQNMVSKSKSKNKSLEYYSLPYQPININSTEATKIICEKSQLTALRNT